jgi:hypothetical protein
MTHTVQEQQFHLEEFKSLRAEILSRSQHRWATERYVLLAISAIYVFLSGAYLGTDPLYKKVGPVL